MHFQINPTAFFDHSADQQCSANGVAHSNCEVNIVNSMTQLQYTKCVLILFSKSYSAMHTPDVCDNCELSDSSSSSSSCYKYQQHYSDSEAACSLCCPATALSLLQSLAAAAAVAAALAVLLGALLVKLCTAPALVAAPCRHARVLCSALCCTQTGSQAAAA
jgi:hypothetical protein